MVTIVLNGFEVDPRLTKLMLREDWEACRGRKQLMSRPLLPNSEAWLERFKSSENVGPHSEGIYGIEFFGIESANRENENLRNSELGILHGKKSKQPSPGDFDPRYGYLIGLTCEVDEGIFVDLRPADGPIITYSNHCISDSRIVTAFHSIDQFVQFYIDQHGS